MGRIRYVCEFKAFPSSAFTATTAPAYCFSYLRYGMTEVGMALSNPYRGSRRPGAVGSPLPGVEVKVQEDGEWLDGCGGSMHQ